MLGHSRHVIHLRHLQGMAPTLIIVRVQLSVSISSMLVGYINHRRILTIICNRDYGW